MACRAQRAIRYLFTLVFSLSSPTLLADLTLNDSPTPTSIKSALDGPGLVIENLRFVRGVKGQYGIFSRGTNSAGSDPVLGITDGIYLTTGNNNSIIGPNNNDKYTYNTRVQYADADLTGISSNAIFDPVIIEFDIIPEGDTVNFLLVFGSEEYPEYVCSKFNDVFGLFVSGPGFSGTRNAANVPGTDYPIAVNHVNGGKSGSAADGADCHLSNSIYFVDNGNGTGAKGTQLDGFTRPITASLDNLQPGKSYKVKMALADAGDQAYDSSAFFKWLTSTSSTTVDLELEAKASTLRPSREGFVDIQYTLRNTSNQSTRLVKVGIELPEGTVLVSDDSSGNFDSIEGIWDIGSLAAQSERTLNIRLNIGSDYSYKIPAEIQYAFNEDPDSTPYNRLSTPDEDDTATLTLYPTTNQSPMITYNNSAAKATLSFPENSTSNIIDLEAEDLDGDREGSGLSWMIAGGNDSEFFTLNAQGQLRFTEPRNFENPQDHDQDNAYEVTAKVCDSHASCDIQELIINISDVTEDADGDGVPAEIEEAIGSDPDKVDTDGDGIDDKTEIGTNTANPPDTDGDGTPDVLDPDDDGDGIPTQQENYNGGSVTDEDTDSDGTPDYLDTDDDGDGLLTKHENYNGGTPDDDDTDRDGKPDYLDNDDDNDGVLTLSEDADPNGDNHPADAKDSENDGKPDYLDSDNLNSPGDDNDGDGLDNAKEEEIGTDPNNPDSDNDGVHDGDNLDNSGNPEDSDHDGIVDALDPDDDNDGILTVDEAYTTGDPRDEDSDLDGKPDYLDDDDDNDSILTRYEDYNGNGPADDDTDGDSLPDYLDIDDDGDGLWTWYENYNAGLPLDDDTDKDGIADYLDTDDDGDRLLTKHESSDPNGNGNPDDAIDSDNDGLKNYRDADDDNDGKLTLDENADPNNDGHPSDALDSDHDDIAEYLDPEETPFIIVKLKAMLQGPYNVYDKLMTDKLRTSGHLLRSQPYSQLQDAFGYGSSGNASPFNYEGSETLSDKVLAVEGNDAVVDWILVEIRDANRPTNILAAKSVVIQRDGNLMMPGSGNLELIVSGVGSGNHYIALRHRNHLGIMTAQPVPLSDTTVYEYDFSSKSQDTYGENARLSMSDYEVMWAGDLNNSNSIIAEGPGSDMSVMLGAILVAPANHEANANYPLIGYYASDLNMDGKSVYSGPSNDTNLMIGNVLLHPNNTQYQSNFVVRGTLP